MFVVIASDRPIEKNKNVVVVVIVVVAAIAAIDDIVAFGAFIIFGR